MSDSESRPQLVVPDPAKRIVSPGEAARIAEKNEKYGPGGKRQVPKSDFMESFVTRREAMEHVANAVKESTNQCFEEHEDALGDRLEQMEQVIFTNVILALERRTLRYRLTMWLRGILTELGWIAPVQLAQPVDAVVALDPNVQAAAAAQVDFEWVMCPTGLPRDLIPRLEGREVVAIARKPGTALWFMVAGTTSMLAAAAAKLGGENPTFEEGVTSTVIDAVFLDRAKKFVESGGKWPAGADWQPTMPQVVPAKEPEPSA